MLKTLDNIINNSFSTIKRKIRFYNILIPIFFINFFIFTIILYIFDPNHLIPMEIIGLIMGLLTVIISLYISYITRNTNTKLGE